MSFFALPAGLGPEVHRIGAARAADAVNMAAGSGSPAASPGVGRGAAPHPGDVGRAVPDSPRPGTAAPHGPLFLSVEPPRRTYKRGDRVTLNGAPGVIEDLSRAHLNPRPVLVRLDDMDALWVLPHRLEPSTLPRPVRAPRPTLLPDGPRRLEGRERADAVAAGMANAMQSSNSTVARMKINQPADQDWRHARGNAWERGEVLAALRRFHAEQGRTPTQRDLPHYDYMPSHGAALRIFGSWTAAVDAAGLPRTKRICDVVWTREMCVEAIRDHYLRTGEWPTSKTFRGAGRPEGAPNSSTVEARCGSWSNAMLEARGEA